MKATALHVLPHSFKHHVPLTGTQNCVLPKHTHREIVDIAVLIITGELQIPDYQIKQAKLNMNKLA